MATDISTAARHETTPNPFPGETLDSDGHVYIHRFGIVECGSTWVGPCVERMDLWCDFMHKVGVKYEMKPSEYVRRNVRVPPFWHENLPLMIERYGLSEVYCFSTDYPHLEGSKDPFGRFGKHLAKLPDVYRRRFFIDNNELLLPHA